jgi:hypothetical protein
MTAKKKKPDSREFREVTRAALRVGLSYRDLTQWLLELSQFDLDDLSEGDRTNLEWEANAVFQIHLSLKRADSLPVKIEKFNPDDLADKKLAQSVGPIMSNKGLLNSYHQIVDEMLEDLANGIPIVVNQNLNQSMEIEDGKLVVKTEASDELNGNLLKLIVFDLLKKTSSQFKICEECETPFMATKRQKYCSTSCSQAMRTRKFQAKRNKNT